MAFDIADVCFGFMVALVACSNWEVKAVVLWPALNVLYGTLRRHEGMKGNTGKREARGYSLISPYTFL